MRENTTSLDLHQVRTLYRNLVRAFYFDQMMYRRITSELGLKEMGVKLDERGYVEVGDYGQANAAGIYAIGEITRTPVRKRLWKPCVELQGSLYMAECRHLQMSTKFK